MAEHGAVGELVAQRRFEAVDFVDALAGERAFFEQVLVNIGNRQGIGVKAVRAGKDALEQRPLQPVQLQLRGGTNAAGGLRGV
jgi:hypothetical protein